MHNVASHLTQSILTVYATVDSYSFIFYSQTYWSCHSNYMHLCCSCVNQGVIVRCDSDTVAGNGSSAIGFSG